MRTWLFCARCFRKGTLARLSWAPDALVLVCPSCPEKIPREWLVEEGWPEPTSR